MPIIKSLFDSDIDRRIEEVIKVDQADETIIRDELREYVVTDSIRAHFRDVFDHYQTTWQKPNEGIAVWVSGFFGSGKSSFAKYLGLGLANRDILGQGAGELLGQRCADPQIQVLLKNISEQTPDEKERKKKQKTPKRSLNWVNLLSALPIQANLISRKEAFSW